MGDRKEPTLPPSLHSLFPNAPLMSRDLAQACVPLGPGLVRVTDWISGPIATQFVAPGSVYALAPTTEAMARAVAAASEIRPVQAWELPRALPNPPSDAGDDEGF